MPKFFCEYCGIYLTHSSPSGRAQHKMQIEQQERMQKEQMMAGGQAPPMQGGGINPMMMSNKQINIPQQMMYNPQMMGGGHLNQLNHPMNISNLQQGGIQNISLNSSIPGYQALQGQKPTQIPANQMMMNNYMR